MLWYLYELSNPKCDRCHLNCNQCRYHLAQSKCMSGHLSDTIRSCQTTLQSRCVICYEYQTKHNIFQSRVQFKASISLTCKRSLETREAKTSMKNFLSCLRVHYTLGCFHLFTMTNRHTHTTLSQTLHGYKSHWSWSWFTAAEDWTWLFYKHCFLYTQKNWMGKNPKYPTSTN